MPKPKSQKTKVDAAPKPIGRPSIYTEELADLICERISSGESIKRICDEPEMPSRETFFRWVFNKKEFHDKYARALEIKADLMRDELLEISDEPPPLTAMGSTDSGAVQHQKLRVDTRKWLMARQAPRKYGDKLDMNHGVQADNPLGSLLQRIAGTGLPIVQEEPDE